jgi:predicted AAA+ superfamily ATPase
MSLADPQTRKRELAALGEAMREVAVDSGTIVTWDESERIEAGGATIEVVPIWRFLLDLLESS